MTEQDDYSFRPDQMPLEDMQEALVNRGWEFSVSEYGTAKFSRAYARVNPVLEADGWREALHNFSSVVAERAPHLPPGMTFSTAGGETEVVIATLTSENDKDDVTKTYMLDAYLRECGFEEIDEAMLSDWLILKGEPGAPEIGSKEYYEQDPRAAELRTICLEVIDNYRRVIVSEGIEGDAIEKLLELNQKLAQLQIVPGMHIGAPKVAFVSPVTRTEWIAGNLRDTLQEGYGFSGQAKAMIEEHNLLAGSGADVAMIDLSNAGSEAPSSILLLMGLSSMADQLDAEADIPEN